MALINPRRKSIFIHLYKTGGSSIRSILGGFEISDTHAPAWLVKRNLANYTEQDLWGEYFTFVVVRNPYDFVISLYHHLKNQKNHVFGYTSRGTIDEFVKTLPTLFINSHFHGYTFMAPQWYWVSENDEVIVDEVYRFEAMAEVYKDLAERIGTDPEGGFVNVSKTRERNVPYTEVFSLPAIDIINKVYAIDFIKFNYTPITL